MALTATLTVNGISYDILRFWYGFHILTDVKGRPEGGSMVVELESTSDRTLMELMAMKVLTEISGSIECKDSTTGQRMRTIEFPLAYLYSMDETMKSASSEPMMLKVAITPLRLNINRIIRIDRRWPQTYSFWWEEYKPEEVESTSVIATEAQKTLKSAEWVVRKTDKAVEYVLSNSWVNLNIVTDGFENGDKLSVTIEEVNSNGIRTYSTEWHGLWN